MLISIQFFITFELYSSSVYTTTAAEAYSAGQTQTIYVIT